ncbi:MAG TPA: MBL fold metallo-hydrolase [Verrucomicrobiae bacterium]|nr:MBL fold metallo-hydrolase [Verrucomicrobiae bacterium]
MRKFALKAFGVGDGWPCADRNHASFLYRLGDVSILVDCGDCISRSYKASGLDYNLIDRIFISHLHSDHVAGFFMLMQGFWLEQRKKDLPVSMPADGIKPISELLNAGLIFKELLQFRLRFEALRVGKPVMTKDVRVTPYPSTHLEQLRRSFQKRYPQDYAAYCFLIERGKLRIGHSADIGCPEDLEPLLKKPLDLLVCELAHFHPEDLFLYLQGRDIKKILFMHVGRSYWEDLKKTQRLAAKMMPDIPFGFLHDGQEVPL